MKAWERKKEERKKGKEQKSLAHLALKSIDAFMKKKHGQKKGGRHSPRPTISQNPWGRGLGGGVAYKDPPHPPWTEITSTHPLRGLENSGGGSARAPHFLCSKVQSRLPSEGLATKNKIKLRHCAVGTTGIAAARSINGCKGNRLLCPRPHPYTPLPQHPP